MQVTSEFVFLSLGVPLLAHRVGGEPLGSRPPSEPCVTVSRHTAQALQNYFPVGITGYLFLFSGVSYSTPLSLRRDLLADAVGRLFFSRSILRPSDRRD